MSLIFPWPRAPQAAQIQPLCPGLSWLCFPLPFTLDHVNVWLLESPDGMVAIDAGIKSLDSESIWREVAVGLVQPLAGVLITHYHPDHIGMAGWLAEHFAAHTWGSRQDLEYAREAYNISDENFTAAQDDWYRINGLDARRRAAMQQAGNTYRPRVHALPDNTELLQQGVDWTVGEHRWQVITVGGHAPEMICLFCAELNVLIAADQVLPSITPNVSLNHYTRDPNPLATFLLTLPVFEALPEDVLVLPSHGLPFRGLRARITELRNHHDERFNRLLDSCANPATAAEMLPVLFNRKLDFQQLMFAMGESIAHLRYLEHAGELITQRAGELLRYSRS